VAVQHGNRLAFAHGRPAAELRGGAGPRRAVTRLSPLAAAVRWLLVPVMLAQAPAPLAAQRLVERSPNLPNSVNVLPGFVEASLSHRFARPVGGSGISDAATFDLAFGMPLLFPLRWTVGLRFAPASAAGGAEEWELYDRVGLLRQAAGAPFDLNLTGAYSVDAGSIDGELSLARRLGPLRVIAAARALSRAYDSDDTRFAVGGGVAWQVAPRSSPLTIAADLAALTDRLDGERVAWSAGVQTGLPHTSLSVSLHATNTTGTSLQRAAVGDRRTRWGLEFNAPVEFAGFLLGVFRSREQAMESVDTDVAAAPAATVRIRGYLYAPATIIVRAGSVIEWVNDDAVVHTVTSENAGFDSRGIQPGERWRARFTEPGIYPYYCGPHPFMKGVVVVR
jgi:plastocyanin